jgi:intein/homing endonuclease
VSQRKFPLCIGNIGTPNQDRAKCEKCEFQDECKDIRRSIRERIIAKLDSGMRQYIIGHLWSVDGNSKVIVKSRIFDKQIKVEQVNELIDRFFNSFENAEKWQYKEFKDPIFDIPCLNPKTLEIEWKPVLGVARHPSLCYLIELTLESGRKIKVTPSHSIYILDSQKGVASKPTSELCIGDFVLIANKIPIPEQNKHEIIFDQKLLSKFFPINYDRNFVWIYQKSKKVKRYIKADTKLMRLLGFYVSEGHLGTGKSGHYNIGFTFGKHEKDLISDISSIIEEIFGIKPSIEMNKHSTVVKINRKAIWGFFKYILRVTEYAKEKRVPQLVFNSSPRHIKEFIKAWLQGDFGYTKSEKLVHDIIYLGLFLGEVIPIYVNTPSCDKVFPNGHKILKHKSETFAVAPQLIKPYIQGNFKIAHKTQKLPLNYVKNILSSNGFSTKWACHPKSGHRISQKTLYKRLPKTGPKLFSKMFKGYIGFSKIRKIEIVRPLSKYVYDFSVQHENFVCNGIICHNSKGDALASGPINDNVRLIMLLEAYMEIYGMTDTGLTGLADPKLYEKVVEYHDDLIAFLDAMEELKKCKTEAEFEVNVEPILTELEDKYSKKTNQKIYGNPKKLLRIIKSEIYKEIYPKIMAQITTVASMESSRGIPVMFNPQNIPRFRRPDIDAHRER